MSPDPISHTKAGFGVDDCVILSDEPQDVMFAMVVVRLLSAHKSPSGKLFVK